MALRVRTGQRLGSHPEPEAEDGAQGGCTSTVRKLESELHRKDKALAEAAALLVLRKKAQAIWGDEDE